MNEKFMHTFIFEWTKLKTYEKREETGFFNISEQNPTCKRT